MEGGEWFLVCMIKGKGTRYESEACEKIPIPKITMDTELNPYLIFFLIENYLATFPGKEKLPR